MIALAFTLSACVPTPVAPSDEPAASVALVSVIDGDTLSTSVGTVRIIGIDSPERGECGYEEATQSIIGLLAPGDPITLTLPAGQNDTDRHDRLLRYVEATEGVDLGLHQIKSGHAIARYDSRDGYPFHPRESEYRAAQIAERGSEGTVITLACR